MFTDLTGEIIGEREFEPASTGESPGGLVFIGEAHHRTQELVTVWIDAGIAPNDMKGADRTLLDRMCLRSGEVCCDLRPGRIGL